MDDSARDTLEERILLLAPTRRDTDAAVRVFEPSGLLVAACKDMVNLCAEMERGVGVAIVAHEAILSDREGLLSRLLAAQPAWSDIPLLVLTLPRHTTAMRQGLESIAHMTLIPRPVEVQSLITTVQAALRDRRRQYARREDLAERDRQARALRENDRRKDEFLAMLAHELRNPLAAVSNAVSVLKKSADEENRHWASDVVDRQVRQLVRLIDDLLDVSRISSGKIRLRKEYVDASPILREAIESARPHIDDRHHTLNVSIDEGHLPVHVDVARVQQIVLNLLTNAAKYTATGGTLWLSARPEHDRVVISVRDDGVGISPEKLPEMFTLFAQGERTLARSEGGLGIGLTIVQKLTEMHGGSVTARSEGPGKGSEFTVRLPLVPRPDRPAGDPQPDRATSAKRSRVLVVDDNTDMALGMVRLLKLLGHEATAAHDGYAAVETASAFVPDYVLLDLGLPGMDGFGVVTALRQDPRLKNTVVIAVSGYGQDEDRRRTQAAGFDHHLVKPVDFDSLLSLIVERA